MQRRPAEASPQIGLVLIPRPMMQNVDVTAVEDDGRHARQRWLEEEAEAKDIDGRIRVFEEEHML